ncbi:MAG TPA: NTP transferase domain-containing protein, partial [Mycobacterium sp.]|nr:NTP transferase domain-containing protein [Mycobacterium sp.]
MSQPSATSSPAAGVLLAAGAGTRFGMPKVLAERGSWLRAAVAALSGGGCDDVVVVLGAAVTTGTINLGAGT